MKKLNCVALFDTLVQELDHYYSVRLKDIATFKRSLCSLYSKNKAVLEKVNSLPVADVTRQGETFLVKSQSNA